MIDDRADIMYQTTAKEDCGQRISIRKLVYIGIKKIADVLLALVGIIICIPIIAIAAAFVKLESEGSIWYTQQRVGKYGNLFTIYKLRTMYSDAEKDGMQWAQKNDPRVTKVGRFLRKTRIDELPQLINIIKGDMSIVGPRPERPYFTELFSREIPEFNKRLAVRPGLTGWSQINGGYELSPIEKLENDLFYIENQSVWLDMIIILKTVLIVINFDGAR